MMGVYYWNGFGMFWDVVINILFWGLIIYGIVSLAQCASKETPSQDRKETPLDILKRRYASGEISAEQFAQMKKDIQ